MNNNLVITLERQFGSGGLEIGKKVADKLGIPCYNKEILESAAEKSNIPEEFLESMQENVSQSLLYKLSLASQSRKKLDSLDSVVPKSNMLYNEISSIIKNMAQKGSCVIIGRCADFILRDFEPCFHVFIYAPMEIRKKRVIENYGISSDSAEYIIRKNDKRRESFYNGNTGHTWGLKEHYNLCLNSGKFGIDNCADIIVDSLKYMQ
ncbi:AAA family ATPase [Porcipelethomonas sp.]|uniref:cytidylate kinase-like family protein n=1 Tax=Porcipelethomonas sp. TaxID=2981675 RepID=UPI003EF4F450